jgi:membrane protein required for colicin V production
MPWLDIVLVLVMLVGGLLGLRSGLLWQVARIVIFAAAIYACIHYHGHAVKFLSENFDGLASETSSLLAYVVTFLGVCLAGFLITFVLESFLRATNLKPLDRVLGAIFGIVKTALLCGGLLTGGMLYGSEKTRDMVGESNFAPPLLKGMSLVLAAVPEKVKQDLDDALEKMKRHQAEKAGEGAPADSREPRPKPQRPTFGPLAP